jgi:hypothetical protein
VFLLGCSSPKEMVMTTNLNNVIYRDLPNPIYFKNGDLKNCKISISNGKIIEIKDESLTVLVDSSHKTSIRIQKHNFDEDFEFRVKKFPSPTLQFITKGKGDTNDMTLEEFKSFRGAYPTLVDFPFDCSFKLESLEIIKISATGDSLTVKATNLKSDITRLTYGAKRGDTYIFNNIKIVIEQSNKIVTGKEFTLHLR